MHFLRFRESGKIFIWNSADRAAEFQIQSAPYEVLRGYLKDV
jgi:hypothetical protein